MAIICIEGLPGKLGKCINLHPPKPPAPGRNARAAFNNEDTYPDFFVDASIIDSIHQAAKEISDNATRTALQSGIEAAVKALINRAGNKGISVTLTD